MNTCVEPVFENQRNKCMEEKSKQLSEEQIVRRQLESVFMPEQASLLIQVVGQKMAELQRRIEFLEQMLEEHLQDHRSKEDQEAFRKAYEGYYSWLGR